MAYGKPSRVRSNFGQFQKYATVNIKKKLQKDADEIGVNVREIVAEKLKEVYIDNVLKSYGPRSPHPKKPYEHTGNTFVENIRVEIEDEPGIGRNRVKIVLNNETYENDGHRDKDVTVRDVYQWLTEGTNGSGEYWFKNENGKRPTAHYYPTPVHLFEQHTQLQMKGFLESLDVRQFVNKRR